MNTKQCSKCQQEKPLSDFPRHKREKGGRLTRCRDCQREYHKKWMADHPGYYQTKKRKKYNYEYHRQRRRDPAFWQRYRARRLTRSAVKHGLLARKSCEKCGNVRSEAHHHDYSKPLEVRWLCRNCHRKECHLEMEHMPLVPLPPANVPLDEWVYKLRQKIISQINSQTRPT